MAVRADPVAPPDHRPTVGVVIRALDEERHIGRLLAGVHRQRMRADQVVVVDSGSTDATMEIARRFDALVETIRPGDFSFGRSLNRGCARLDTDVIVVVSAHVYPVYDSWLELLVEPLRDPRIGVSYGRQVGDHRTTFSEQRLMERWFPARSTPEQSHPFCNNANAAVRRGLWDELGFDEDLTGLEDLDFARRALQRGHLLSYVATAPVVHVHQETWDRLRNRYRREAIAHRRIFQDQRMSAPEAVRLAVRNVAADYHAARRQGVLARNLLTVPRFHAAQFVGAYQGFAQSGEVTAELKRRFYYPTAQADQQPPTAPIGNPIDYSGTRALRIGNRTPDQDLEDSYAER